MKHFILSIFCFITICLTLSAKPAKRIVTNLVQPDGSTIKAITAGDEFLHYYIDFNTGKRLKKDREGFWKRMSGKEIIQQNELVKQERLNRKPTKVAAGGLATFGDNSHILLLVEFSNHKFSKIGTKQQFENFANGDNYTFQGATGSVKQYFKDQSLNQYNPTFDVIGPVCVDSTYQYYGTKDQRMQELVANAVEKAHKQGLISDFSKYDNDKDGYVDLVYVITAGYSEADNPTDNVEWPWPHQWSLKQPAVYDNVNVFTYAFSTELQGSMKKANPVFDGIGSMAHEFGHALGLPDMYNTGDEPNCYGMEYWDVMDAGCYNNEGYTPPSYTAHERDFLGWCKLDTLPENEEVTLEPFGKGNKAFVLYNPNNRNEYLTFEYHNQDGSWDQYWGGYGLHGLLVIHTDYDEVTWYNNTVNCDPEHQHCTVVPADNELLAHDRYSNGVVTGDEWYHNFVSDIFPGEQNISKLNTIENQHYRWFDGPTIMSKIQDIREAEDFSKVTFTVKTKKFGQLEAIELVQSGNSIQGIYNLNGNYICNSIESVAEQGIYIVKYTNGESVIYRK